MKCSTNKLYNINKLMTDKEKCSKNINVYKSQSYYKENDEKLS